LAFHLDRGVKNSIAISKILQEVLGEDEPPNPAERPSTEETADRDEPA
jgi:hypothetical protein